MKEGRMKGQAFVTLPSEDKAKRALREAHGYILHGKPIVIVSLVTLVLYQVNLWLKLIIASLKAAKYGIQKP